MLVLLASHWGLLLLRAAIAMLLGILVILWPELSLTALIHLVGGYALLDGIVTLIVAFQARGLPRFAALLAVEGLVRAGAAVVSFAYPDISQVALLQLIAAWAVSSGIVEIAASIAVRREMSRAWPLLAAGAMSVIFGALLMLRLDAGILPLAWTTGIYAFCFGLVLVSFALRLRQLAP